MSAFGEARFDDSVRARCRVEPHRARPQWFDLRLSRGPTTQQGPYIANLCRHWTTEQQCVVTSGT